MTTFSDHFSKLAPLLEFDSKALIGDEKIPQELCSFILALALAYNDYKLYMISLIMLMDSEPDGQFERTPEWGEYAGIKLHIIRLHVGFAHELLKLIKKNARNIENDFFKEIIRKLSPKARKSWANLVNVALMKEKSNLLARIRNTVAFHYDADEVFSGYQAGFFKDGVLQNACISKGNTLQESRFYFADLAIQGYFEKTVDTNIEDFYSSLIEIMQEINNALYEIVTKFIQGRGFAWRKPVKEK
ncbi:MAG: hypothetical protein ABII75_07185 [Candidatus Omnitrophota bacterium]